MKLLIGNTIKYLRRERGITQEELAEILGVSCQSVSRWENNTCYPDIELAKKLGMSRKSLWEKRKRYGLLRTKHHKES